MKLTTIELFAGIGGFRIASDSLGLKTVWANDIDALACSVYRTNFGSRELVEGDIRSLVSVIPKHDLLTAGFPCQPFSAAGKKEGIRDPRGTLFEVIVEILQKQSPKFFVLENVKRLLGMERGSHFATVLSALAALDYFVEWRLLSAKNFGLAQNRERVVIVGTKTKATATKAFNCASAVRLLPSADFVGTHIESRISHGLADCQLWKPIEKHKLQFPTWGVAMEGRFFAVDADRFTRAIPGCTLKDVLEREPAEEFDLTEGTLQRLRMNVEVNRYVHGVEVISNQGGGARMGYTIFGVNGLAPTLTASTSRHYERYKVGKKYRRLTPTEYARLQGFPDKHCGDVRGYDQYTLFGNAVPPAMVAWAMNRLIRPVRQGQVETSKANLAQGELFHA